MVLMLCGIGRVNLGAVRLLAMAVLSRWSNFRGVVISVFADNHRFCDLTMDFGTQFWKAQWRKVWWLSQYQATMGDGYPAMDQWLEGPATAFQLFTHPKTIAITITAADSESDLGSPYARLTFSCWAPTFFILKNFHPIYPDVTKMPC